MNFNYEVIVLNENDETIFDGKFRYYRYALECFEEFKKTHECYLIPLE